MKNNVIIWTSLIILGLVSCEKSEDKISIDSIVDTKWKLAQIIDEASVTSDFPNGIDDFEIVFRKNGKIDLINLCNYSFATYNIKDNDVIKIENIGEGTYKHCLPEIAMDWENHFINKLNYADSYSIINEKLTINCQGSKLIFDFVSNYDCNNNNNLFIGKWGLVSLIGFTYPENFNDNDIIWEFLSDDSLQITINIVVPEYSRLPVKSDSILLYSYDSLTINIGQYDYEYKIEENSLKLYDNLVTDGMMLEFERK